MKYLPVLALLALISCGKNADAPVRLTPADSMAVMSSIKGAIRSKLPPGTTIDTLERVQLVATGSNDTATAVSADGVIRSGANAGSFHVFVTREPNGTWLYDPGSPVLRVTLGQ